MSDELAETPEPEAAPTGGLKTKLPMIAAIVVGLAVGAGSGAMLIGPLLVSKLGISAPKAPNAAGDSASVDETTTKEGAAGEHGADAKAVAPPVVLLENIVLNPAGSGGSRYLLMSIAIEGANAKAAESFGLRDAELKDLILTTLGRKTVEELSDVSGREAIKAELIAAVIARFGKGSVKQLYFPQFVIQ